eukprot:COSAG04_NODE_13484_length_604_cov_1.116832_1_plen_130_part_10
MSDEAEMSWGRQQYDQQAGRGSLVAPDSVFADDAVGLMACERFEGTPKERKLEHRVLAERMGARFDQVAKGAYKTMKVRTEMSKCTATFDQAEHYDDSPITEAEISALDPRYECRACSRRFLSLRARTSH